MTITLGVGEIAILIIALAFLALVFALIPALLQTRRTVKALEDLASESKSAVENVNRIVKAAGEQIEDVEELAKKVKDVGLKLTDLLETVLDTVKSPLLTLVSLIVGVEFGFRKFLKREKKEEHKGGD
ncbi:MAG: DUF948 domain-containing protein [Deltaproteobacteria bacterium]|nr:DUF948 domain-containing protein [Deltaproteobacteria bacterium]